MRQFHPGMLVRDDVILTVVQLTLAILLFIAMVQALKAKRSGSFGSAVTRGDRSMNFLYVFYGVATVAFILIVQIAEAAKGYKAAIVAADYLALTYLCFFNGWFRNKLIGIY